MTRQFHNNEWTDSRNCLRFGSPQWWSDPYPWQEDSVVVFFLEQIKCPKKNTNSQTKSQCVEEFKCWQCLTFLVRGWEEAELFWASLPCAQLERNSSFHKLNWGHVQHGSKISIIRDLLHCGDVPLRLHGEVQAGKVVSAPTPFHIDPIINVAEQIKLKPNQAVPPAHVPIQLFCFFFYKLTYLVAAGPATCPSFTVWPWMLKCKLTVTDCLGQMTEKNENKISKN